MPQDPQHALIRTRESNATLGISTPVSATSTLSAISVYRTVPDRLNPFGSPVDNVAFVFGYVYTNVVLLRLPRLHQGFSAAVLLARRAAVGSLYGVDTVRFANSQRYLRETTMDGLMKLAMEWSKTCSYSMMILT